MFPRRITKTSKSSQLKLDVSHDYYPNKLCYFFEGTPTTNYDLTSGKRPVSIVSVSDMTAIGAAYPDNRVLDVAYNAGTQSSYNIPSFFLPADEPWEITLRFKKGTTAAEWAMLIGKTSDTVNFISPNESGAYFRFRNPSGTSYDFTGTPSFEEKLKTYTLTSDGGGAGACTLKLYIDEALFGTKTATTPTINIDAIMDAYTSNAFSFEGQVSHIRVSQGTLYNDAMVRDLHSNLYQVLQPRTQLLPLTIPAVSGFKPAWAMASSRSGMIGAR